MRILLRWAEDSILPKSLRHRALYLRGACLIRTKKYREAREAAEEARACLDEFESEGGGGEEENKEMRRKIEIVLKSVERFGEKEDQDKEGEEKDVDIDFAVPTAEGAMPGGRHPKFPFLSSALKVESAPDKLCKKVFCFPQSARSLRRTVAAREIEAGEVLSVCRAALCIPLCQSEGAVCDGCLKFQKLGLPCRGCRKAAFCSEQCRDGAKGGIVHHITTYCAAGAEAERMNEAGTFYQMTVPLLLKAVLKEKGGFQEQVRKVRELRWRVMGCGFEMYGERSPQRSAAAEKDGLAAFEGVFDSSDTSR